MPASRFHSLRPRRSSIVAVAALVATLGFTVAASASHPEVSLPGSNFEIDTDANLKLDDPAPSIDWGTVAETRKADSPSGTADESFGQGTKEDTAVPSVVDGSIPPNKSDLKFFGVFQEGSGGNGFLNMYWSRVQDPSGTTNMDFEFNKRQCTPGQSPADPDCTSNGITPIRTAGDLLVIYDLSQGGTRPTLSIREWTGLAWGAPTDLTASNKATGSINTSPIPAADADGLGAHSARTFGEAQLDLSAIFDPNICESFGSVYLKSRSSDSFTAALKDFVPPAAVNIANCGGLNVTKYIDNDESGTFNTGDNGSLVTGDLTGWSFTVAGPGGFSCTGTTDATGNLTGCALGTLAAGTYTITENANAGKTLGTNSSPFVNTDPGTAARSKQAVVTIGGNQTVRFGNTCTETASFSVTGVPAGTTGMFVDYKVNGGTTQTVALSTSGSTRTASVGGLRRGDVVTWSFGINNDHTASHLVAGSSITLPGYPSCAASGSAQFQNATVTALKYKDINADGTRQAVDGENGLQGFSFELRSGATVVASTKSTGTGLITFSNVAPGSYTIHEVNRPTGWQQTEPAANGNLAVTVNLGDTSVDAGRFGNTPLSTIDVGFNSLAKLPNADGTPSATDATHATSISCTDKNGADAGSSTGNNNTTSNLTLNKSSVTCVITFVDP